MSANLRRYTKALYTLDAVARRVPSDAWDNQSCCQEWTARQVAGHASWVIRNVGAATGAFPPPAPQGEAEVAGADPAAAVRSAVEATIEAFDRPGIVNKVSATPFGEMPLDDFIGVIWVDALTHAWDIADAAGIDHGIDEATASAAYESLAPLSDALRAPGRFDPALDSDGDALARFIAFTGRRPVSS